MRRLVQVRLSDDLVTTVDHLAVDWGVFRGEAMDRLLREAITKHTLPAYVADPRGIASGSTAAPGAARVNDPT